MEQQVVVSGKKLLSIAKLTSVVGLKGDFKVSPVSLDLKELKNFLIKCKTFFLYSKNKFPKKVNLKILKDRKDFLILNFNEIEDITCAKDFKDYLVLADKDKLDKFLSKTKSSLSLIGFKVLDKKLGFLGKIIDIDRRAQELIVLEDKKVFPMVDNFIDIIDYENKLLKVNLPEGIF
jgi:ribosomal 30S subunit maturation factor RimM